MLHALGPQPATAVGAATSTLKPHHTLGRVPAVGPTQLQCRQRPDNPHDLAVQTSPTRGLGGAVPQQTGICTGCACLCGHTGEPKSRPQAHLSFEPRQSSAAPGPRTCMASKLRLSASISSCLQRTLSARSSSKPPRSLHTCQEWGDGSVHARGKKQGPSRSDTGAVAGSNSRHTHAAQKPGRPPTTVKFKPFKSLLQRTLALPNS